jgi:hypothetical protein
MLRATTIEKIYEKGLTIYDVRREYNRRNILDPDFNPGRWITGEREIINIEYKNTEG